MTGQALPQPWAEPAVCMDWNGIAGSCGRRKGDPHLGPKWANAGVGNQDSCWDWACGSGDKVPTVLMHAENPQRLRQEDSQVQEHLHLHSKPQASLSSVTLSQDEASCSRKAAPGLEMTGCVSAASFASLVLCMTEVSVQGQCSSSPRMEGGTVTIGQRGVLIPGRVWGSRTVTM